MQHKKFHVVLKIIICLLCIFSIVTAAVGIAAMSFFESKYNRMQHEDPLNTNSPNYVSEVVFTSIPTVEDFGPPPDPTTGESTTSQGTNTGTGSATPSTSQTTVSKPVTTAPTPSTSPSTGGSDDGLMQFSKKVTNILLIGTDSRTSDARGRSDSIIILSINEETHQVVVTSLLRDIYLHIPRVDKYNRINAAYAYGGVSLLVEAIRENFNIQIDKYVRVGFGSFQTIVDRLGGIELELSQEEIDWLKISDHAKPGMVCMTGAETLKFCRCRYVKRGPYGSDFARTARQREVIAVATQKLRGLSISEMNSMLNEFLPMVATNLTQDELLTMIMKVSDYLTYEIKSYSIPVTGSWKYATIDGMSVLSIDFAKNIAAIESMIKGTYGK